MKTDKIMLLKKEFNIAIHHFNFCFNKTIYGAAVIYEKINKTKKSRLKRIYNMDVLELKIETELHPEYTNISNKEITNLIKKGNSYENFFTDNLFLGRNVKNNFFGTLIIDKDISVNKTKKLDYYQFS